jgi:hypothetical protein
MLTRCQWDVDITNEGEIRPFRQEKFEKHMTSMDTGWGERSSRSGGLRARSSSAGERDRAAGERESERTTTGIKKAY